MAKEFYDWVFEEKRKKKMAEYTAEELRILSKPVGDLSAEEYEVLKDVFIRQGLTPPIIIKGGFDGC